MTPTDPESLGADDQTKLIAIYERLCPDDVLSLDDPRRPIIAAEIMDIGKATSVEEALSVIEWWHQPAEWAREFVVSARRTTARLKLSAP